ncbi:Hint domain-containing protein [Paracoccus aminophilus]|uniref:Hemolysin-type calcium-binding region n=1 Tax=Paracoccus aminophilus JCM 7686 TaxID=1367847 RepID=S5Z170_PARAH|nr:Hint domain-containing protein [Paracoccus aminophilus]AGT11176.1 hemolysin-type calcium-binding region [Paracoccus aminophilus JCM 7686]
MPDPIYGNGRIDGTPDADLIYGGAGNDSIYGNGGQDSLYGGGGDDVINTGQDGSLVYGGDGNDNIHGADGNDTIYGGNGNDNIDGGGGSNLIYGGDGDDTIRGGGNSINNTLFGGAGNDVIITDNSDDLLYGGEGNDTIDGNDGNDTIYGDEGDDSLSGGNGDDLIYGGTGADTVFGGSGDDTIFGDEGNDSLLGEDGNDLIYGGDGDDTLSGGSGIDTLYGGVGNDLLYGGDGNDFLYGGDGDDTLYGGEGNDFIDGGPGHSTMTGGDGFDTFVAHDGGLITDFNLANGGNFNDGNQSNNDFVDLAGFYNADNLKTYNDWARANGAPTYPNAIEWMRGDQEDDGVLNDHSTAHGFGSDFSFTIQNNGQPVRGQDLTWDNTNVVCFSADALIETAHGEVRAGHLETGDLVFTSDHGLQAIQWVGQRLISEAEFIANPKIRPIRISKGALGDNIPSSDLVVSPQHRVLIRSKIAQRMFGTNEVLVAAKQLLSLDGVEIATDLTEVTYVHFMFDGHEVVRANGAECESMYTGEEALHSVGAEAREEIYTLFPELRDGASQPPARLLLSGRMGRKLAIRHRQNRRVLVS